MRKLLWREYEMDGMWTAGNEMWKLLWRESASGRDVDGGSMGCGSCSGVNTRWAGCGRRFNGMWKLLWREYEMDGMWLGGKWDVEFFWREYETDGMWSGGKWDAEVALA